MVYSKESEVCNPLKLKDRLKLSQKLAAGICAGIISEDMKQKMSNT